MGRKLRSMFKQVTPQPGSAERPASTLGPAVAGGGLEPGAVLESAMPIGTPHEVKQQADPDREEVAKLAYHRWLETGGGEVENWVWAENELRRRAD